MRLESNIILLVWVAFWYSKCEIHTSRISKMSEVENNQETNGTNNGDVPEIELIIKVSIVNSTNLL